MDLYTANAAHSLHAQGAQRSIRELEYRRLAKERAELRAATEERHDTGVSTRLTWLRGLLAAPLPNDAVVVSGKSDPKAVRRGAPTECRP